MTNQRHLTSMLIIGVLVVGIIAPALSTHQASAFTSTSVNPSSGIGFKGTQFAIVTNVATAGTVGKIVVTFPAGTTLTPLTDYAIVTKNDVTVPGTTTVDTVNGIATFTLTTATPMSIGDKLFLFIEKVRNPAVLTNTNVALTIATQDSLGNPIESSTGNFGLQPIPSLGGSLAVSATTLGTGQIEDNTITVTGAQTSDQVVCQLQGSSDGLVIENSKVTGANTIDAKILAIFGPTGTTGSTINCITSLPSGQ